MRAGTTAGVASVMTSPFFAASRIAYPEASEPGYWALEAWTVRHEFIQNLIGFHRLLRSPRSGPKVGESLKSQIPMSRTHIADFLGLTTETVSRTITGLSRVRLIASDRRRRIALLDIDRLTSLADGGARM